MCKGASQIKPAWISERRLLVQTLLHFRRVSFGRQLTLPSYLHALQEQGSPDLFCVALSGDITWPVGAVVPQHGGRLPASHPSPWCCSVIMLPLRPLAHPVSWTSLSCLYNIGSRLSLNWNPGFLEPSSHACSHSAHSTTLKAKQWWFQT